MRFHQNIEPTKPGVKIGENDFCHFVHSSTIYNILNFLVVTLAF